MDYREFSKTGVRVSVIGMGTYYDPAWIVLSRLGVRRVTGGSLRHLGLVSRVALIFVDTAEIYGSEPLVGEAIRGFNRDELFIATKVWPRHLRYDDVIKGYVGEFSDFEIK